MSEAADDLIVSPEGSQPPAQEPAREISSVAANEQSTVDSEQGSDNGISMRVPSHGNGMIYANGIPDHLRWKGGALPSPTAKLRDMMRKGLQDLLPGFIDDIRSGKLSKAQGIDILAKYGIGATGTVTIVSPDVLQRLERQAMLIASRPEWDSRDLLVSLREIWA